MSKYSTLFLIWYLILTYSLFAQIERISFERISDQQGLSQSTITYIHQDNRGFIWFGTYEGLNRYDGLHFKVFQHDPEDPNSISYVSVSSICECKNGDFWIGTAGGGINRFIREKEQFQRYQADPADSNSLSHDMIRTLMEDHKGNLWIASWGGGLDRLDPETGLFHHHRHQSGHMNSLLDNRVSSVSEDSEGILWIATASGLCAFDPEKNQYTHYVHNPDNPRSLSLNDASCVHVDPQDNVWVGTWGGGLNRLNRKTGDFIRYQHNPSDPGSISYNIIRTITSDNKGSVYVGTWGGGLNIFDFRKNRFVHLKNNPSDLTSISGDFIYSILIDQQNILWVGTDFMGINKFDPNRQKLAHYKNNPKDLHSLSNNTVFSIVEDENDIFWLGTAGGGLNRFDRKKDIFRNYKNRPDDPGSLSNNVVKTICRDPSGSLWIGTEIGLNLFNPATGRFTVYQPDPDDPASLSFNNIYEVFIDRFGELWVGTYSGGLDKFNRRTQKFKHFRYDPDDENSISDNHIWCIMEDKSGTLWIGTDLGGLNKFDRQTEKFVRYQYDPNITGSLSDNKVLTMYEDSGGTLWFGTTAGLNRLDRENNQFVAYKVEQGLPSNAIQGILEDDHGHLWISTKNGLSNFDPAAETFQNFDVSSGVQGTEFCVNSCYRTENGEMFFGGVNGFNIFHPDSLRKNEFIPPVVITNFQLFNQNVPIGEQDDGSFGLEKSITESSEITLSHEFNVISFEFAALNFSFPENNQYAYMMEGFEKDWNYVGDRHFVTYTSLRSGSYIFRVKASNNDGVWNEEGVSLRIKIKPPFWDTWAFRLITSMILVFAIYRIYRYRIHSMQKMNRRLEQRVRERTAELQISNEELEAFAYSISHDLRSPLRSMQGFSSIILEEYQSKLDDQAVNYLKRITSASQYMDHLIDDLLKLSRISRTSLIRETIHISQIAEKAASKIKSEKPDSKAEFVITPDLTASADKYLIRLALDNLLSNAWKFSSKNTKARIEFGHLKKEEGDVFFVKDNGIGFDMKFSDKLFEPFQRLNVDFEGTGIGLTTVERIIRRHGGEIWAEGKEGKGATFYFTLEEKQPSEQK